MIILINMPVSIDEFLQRIGSQPAEGNTWSALITSSLDSQDLVDDLKETLSIFAECEIGCLSAEDGANILTDKIQNTEDYLILWNFEKWDKNNWYQFDCMRSALIKKRGVVLILSPESAKTMFSYAPNIVSWLGSRVYSFLKDTELLSTEEIEERLATLREWSGLTDSQVIEMAEARTLPPEPEFAEWLVLLERGDLIEQ
ncbi:ABC transporter permease [Cylindrospermum sp. FACHB-282]|uniref:ABC transporter permease n=1 Tax=Cylindrospermum sp. FACHB-282 TaxID=2692794 RepID=UPI0016829E29|nr:ABC transporter permease [Cylindrospermum sp. FACHB-282]MBD2384249.1 ABC transporter permease [Cylindrospermum sp. FACHB-282]